MKEHSEITRLLPAYCGGDLSKQEQVLVDEHLLACETCRADLAELQAALKLVRTTPEVEPPPWMTARIMARIREEQAEKTGWLQRIFFPLHVKLPLEALALLMVCVTSYYLLHNMETEVGLPLPQAGPPEVAPQQQPAEKAGEAAPAAAPRNIQQKAAEQTQPAPTVQPASPGQSLPAAPAPYAPAPPAFKAEQATPSAGAEGGARDTAPAAESYERSREVRPKAMKTLPRMQLQESEPVRPAAAGRADSAGAVPPVVSLQTPLRLRFIDPATASEAIRQALAGSAGRVVEEFPSGQRRLKAQLPAARFAEFLEQLERSGTIVEQPQPPSRAGMVEIVIVW